MLMAFNVQSVALSQGLYIVPIILGHLLCEVLSSCPCTLRNFLPRIRPFPRSPAGLTTTIQGSDFAPCVRFGHEGAHAGAVENSSPIHGALGEKNSSPAPAGATSRMPRARRVFMRTGARHGRPQLAPAHEESIVAHAGSDDIILSTATAHGEDASERRPANDMHPHGAGGPGMELDFLGLRPPPDAAAAGVGGMCHAGTRFGLGGSATARRRHEPMPFAARRDDERSRPMPPPPHAAVGADVPAAGNQRPPSAAASSGTLTIFYAGSVHLFDNVPLEKAEQILSLAAKEAAAVRQPEPAAHPKTSQMMTFWAQAHAKSGVPLARNASLARFLERRRQRLAASAAMDAFGNMEQQPWAIRNPNHMNEDHDEDTLDTELKI
ncbi:hypothetical protein ACP70R_027748 [Stipagrostis hirtigluma subsp. patula]